MVVAGIVVAAQIGMSHSCLDAWVRQAKIDQGEIPAGAGLTTKELAGVGSSAP